MTREPLTLEEIQDEIVLEESQPSHEALLRWCERYPEHQQTLSRFFATWANQVENLRLPEVDEALAGSRMVSHALHLVHKLREAKVKERADARLYKMIKAAGVTEDEVKEQCKLDDSLLAKLDRRLITLSSIPAACLQRLAAAIKVEVQSVVNALTGDPIPLGSYKSKSKPLVAQESFRDALASSDLGDSAKKEWEELLSSENKN